MKVVHMCMEHFGGAGTAAYRLHKALLRAGAQSRMCVLKSKGDEPEIRVATPPGGWIHESRGRDGDIMRISDAWVRAGRQWMDTLNKHPDRPPNLEIFTDVDSSLDLSDIPELADADIIHLHWIAGMVDMAGELGPLATKTVVWTLHDMNAFTGGCHYSAGCERWKQGCGACPALGSTDENDVSRATWLARKTAYPRLSPTVVTPSKWLGGLAEQSPLFEGSEKHVIANGLETEVFKPWATEKVRKELGVKQDAYVLLFGAASVQNHRKGFRQLVRGLQALKQRGQVEDAVLAVFGEWAGGEPDLPYPVLELGYITDEATLAAVYSMSDMFVLPSLEDNLPSVVLEALSCGTPVAAFDVGGIGEMVSHRRTGWLATPYEAESLADGMAWGRAMKVQDRALTMRCRASMLERFTAHVQARAYMHLYESLLANAAKPDKVQG